MRDKSLHIGRIPLEEMGIIPDTQITTQTFTVHCQRILTEHNTEMRVLQRQSDRTTGNIPRQGGQRTPRDD